MKRITLALAALAALALLVAGPAAAKPIHCPKGKHRNGHKCVKNHVVRGPQGEVGPVGPAGPTGPVGPGSHPVDGPALLYDNITPESRVDNPVSLGFAATQTTQFGSQVALGREGGVVPRADGTTEVEVLMSVWTCETGEWNAGCFTVDPQATFAAPLTLNVYSVGSENSVGALLSSTTKTFALHYRPTSNCPGDPTKYVAADGHCNHGEPVPVTFAPLANLPHKAILAVSFAPTGPLASLNVALEGPPTIGSNPLEAIGEAYGDYGVSTTFGLEGEWVPGEGQIAARIIG